jgi:thiol-disulfide isomerase/thioredoxin
MAYLRLEESFYMRKLALILVLPLVVFGCNKPVSSTNAASDKPSANDSRKPLPDFEVPRLEGGTLKSVDLKGKVTVLDFWATWCEPCKNEIPDYNALQQKYAGKDFQIIGMTVESGSADEIKSEIKKQGLDLKYPLLVGDDKVVDAFGGLIGFPTTFLITKDGKIQRKFLGEIPGKQQQLTKAIDALLE